MVIRGQVKPSSSSTTKESNSIRSLFNLDPLVLLPSPSLILRSAAVVSTVLAAIFVALSAWLIFYNSVGVKIGEVETVWLQYGHFRPPYSDILLNPAGSYFANGQTYDVTLDIIVPSSTRNVELGNFMVNLELRNRNGSPSFNVSRPASLAYRSPISLALSAFSPTSLFRSLDIQHLSIPLAESTILRGSGFNPYAAYIELGRKDAHWNGGKWDGGGGEVQVYSARLRFDAHLSGLRYILYHHSILSFIIFFPTFLFLELLSALLLWAIFVVRSNPREGSARPNYPPPPSPPSFRDSQVPKVKVESEDPFLAQDRLEAKLQREAQVAAAARSGSRMMQRSDDGSLTNSEEGWEESGTEMGEEEDVSSGDGSWENAGEGSAGVTGDLKDEYEGDSVSGGSATTRGTTSTFGPSLASTTGSSMRSRTTTSST